MLKSLAVAQKDLKKVRRLADKVEQAKANLRAGILAANETGESSRDIAPYARLSHGQVSNLLAEARRERDRPGS